jgi:L-ribulose-5-phosphate 3-epimerase
VGNITGFTNILEGDVNWIAVRDALRAVGYDDVVTAEIAGYKTLPELGIKHSGESLKRIFKGA